MGEGSKDAKRELLELDDPTAVSADGAESGLVQRPTVAPAFDPVQYAERAELSDFRERMPTLIDDAALEEARLQSLPSDRPARAAPAPRPPPPAPPPAPPQPISANEQSAILARLAPLSRVPALAKEISALGALLQDPKTAYVLGFVDGVLPLETIIDVTGLPELDTLRVLDRMVAQGIIVFRAGG